MKSHRDKENIVITDTSDIGVYGYCKLCHSDMQIFKSDDKVRHYNSHRYFRVTNRA